MHDSKFDKSIFPHMIRSVDIIHQDWIHESENIGCYIFGFIHFDVIGIFVSICNCNNHHLFIISPPFHLTWKANENKKRKTRV